MRRHDKTKVHGPRDTSLATPRSKVETGSCCCTSDRCDIRLQYRCFEADQCYLNAVAVG